MSGGALAVLVLAMWSLWPSSPAPSASAPAPPPAPRGAQQSRSAAPAVPPVKLEQLSAERQPPSDTPRNPFRYQPKAPPPAPKPVGVPPPPANVSTEPAKPMPPPGPPPPPPIPLKFIGTLTRANGVQWAALSDGKVVMYGRDGDIIDGRYRIVKIGTESIELTYVDGRGRQVVRLTGQ